MTETLWIIASCVQTGLIIGYLAAPLVQISWTKMKKAISEA